MFSKFTSKLMKLKNDERGASAIEYAVMAAILVVIIVFGVGLLGGDGNTTTGIGKAFNTISSSMNP